MTILRGDGLCQILRWRDKVHEDLRDKGWRMEGGY